MIKEESKKSIMPFQASVLPEHPLVHPVNNQLYHLINHDCCICV